MQQWFSMAYDELKFVFTNISKMYVKNIYDS